MAAKSLPSQLVCSIMYIQTPFILFNEGSPKYTDGKTFFPLNTVYAPCHANLSGYRNPSISLITFVAYL